MHKLPYNFRFHNRFKRLVIYVYVYLNFGAKNWHIKPFIHIVWKSLKCRTWIFQFWQFSPIFVLLKLTCLVKLYAVNISGIFDEFLSTQNVNVARFARNVEWDFSAIFKHREPLCFVFLWCLDFFRLLTLICFAVFLILWHWAIVDFESIHWGQLVLGSWWDRLG